MKYYKMFENREADKVLAHVIVFDDGQTIVKWAGEIQSLVIHKNLDEFINLSIKDGRILTQSSFYLF